MPPPHPATPFHNEGRQKNTGYDRYPILIYFPSHSTPYNFCRRSPAVQIFLRLTSLANSEKMPQYEGVSKSPRALLITRKSLVVHEFPARVCCDGVLWVSVPSGVVGCGSVWLLHVSLCVYCISCLRFSDIGVMAEVDEQKVCIKFCVWLGRTGSSTFEMLRQAFGDSCMSRSRTFEWFGPFKNGRTSTANDDRSGRRSTATTPSKVEQVRTAVNQDRRRTIHDLCAEVGIGYGSCQRILTEQLNMNQIAA